MASRLTTYTEPILWRPYFFDAVAALTQRAPLPVKVCACRAVVKFSPSMPSEEVLPNLSTMVQSICEMAREATDVLIGLILETLTRLVKLNADVAGSLVGSVATVAMTAWRQYPEDPYIYECAIDVISVLCSFPSVRPLMEQELFPMIGSILQSADQVDANVVERALTLLTTVVQYADEASCAWHDSAYWHASVPCCR